MTSASLSALDPTLIDGLRNQVAMDFATRVFNAIPDISECIEFEAEAAEGAAAKRRFERASQLLYARRRDLESQAATTVRRLFDERLALLKDGAMSGSRFSPEAMTLLADERLDEEIAVNHCSRRLKEQCEYELWDLTRRIAVMTGISHPADNQNPVFTQIFAQALMEAIGSLESDAAVRLVVFKTFGPVLLEIVPAVYASANASLKSSGIDVDSDDYYGQPVLTQQRQSAPLQHQIVLDVANANQGLTVALSEILAKSASTLPVLIDVSAESASNEPASTTQLSAVGMTAANEPIWQPGLRAIQASTTKAGANRAAFPRTLHDARRTLQEKLTRDERMIGDIITVMFDRMLSDTRMPPRLREIASRLQIPVLEVALKDRSLLTQVEHPVRKLFDLIAEFGLALELGDGDDSTVRSVEIIIDGLVQLGNDNPNAFKIAYDRLDDLFYHHEEVALQTNESLRSLERQEATEFAGRQADREIAVRLQNLTLPSAIVTFIRTTWRDVLVHDYLYGGPLGDPWKLGLATLDDIVKSLRPSTDEAVRQRLAKSLPSFIEALLITPQTDEDLDVVSANFFVELQRAHELALAGRWEEIGGDRFVPSPDALAEPTDIASPSAALSKLGLACGDWIETRDFAGTRRWRLNWITTIRGTCVFKHYESNTIRNMSCGELLERLESGDVQPVRSLGLADEMMNSAFETVSRKVRLEEAKQASGVPSAANRRTSHHEVVHQWGNSPPTQLRATATRSAHN